MEASLGAITIPHVGFDEIQTPLKSEPELPFPFYEENSYIFNYFHLAFFISRLVFLSNVTHAKP